jgi:hypothetical protein
VLVLKQIFKTYGGAYKRARFETAHSNPRFFYGVRRVQVEQRDRYGVVDTYRIVRNVRVATTKKEVQS